MKRTKTKPIPLAHVFDALGDCLTPKSAKRILAIKLNKQQVARLKQLGERCNEGLLTHEESVEYAELVNFGTLLSTLSSKARQLLAQT